LEPDTNSTQQQKISPPIRTQRSKTSKVQTGFYRFRITSSPLIILILGCGLILISPQENLGKITFGAVLIISGLLSLFSPLMRERYANGIRLENNGFTIQRGILGLLKQSYSYAGFLRVFELPTKRELVLVFAKPYMKIGSMASVIQSSETTSIDPEASLVWLVLPSIGDSNFVPHFLHNVEKDEGYQKTASQLPDIDVRKAYQAQLGQPLRQMQRRLQMPFVDFLSIIRTLGTSFGIINTPISANPDEAIFPAIKQQTQPAIILLFVGLFIATIGSIIADTSGASTSLVRSIQLLALIWLSGPLAWLIFEFYKQQARVILDERTIQFHQPFRLFNRTIPYRHIMLPTALENDAIAFIWLKPRKIAPGDEQRPPKARLLTSVPIQGIARCLAAIEKKTEQNSIPSEYDDWTVEQHIYRRRSRRAIFRRFLLLVVLPAISFILFLIVIKIRAGLLS
jgi:hypothetical protein